LHFNLAGGTAVGLVVADDEPNIVFIQEEHIWSCNLEQRNLVH
jgi:hypothetical protein